MRDDSRLNGELADDDILHTLLQTTGVPLEVAARFQINLLLQPNKGVGYVASNKLHALEIF
jgi:hypothetical protein